jgi:hypothetical protein
MTSRFVQRRPTLTRRVHHVDHINDLKVQASELALQGSQRCGREQFAADRVEDRKSGRLNAC